MFMSRAGTPIVIAVAVAATASAWSPGRSLDQQPSAQVTTPPPTSPPRPGPPTRDPLTPGYVKATELPDGEVPAANVNGNFIIGPTHPASPDVSVRAVAAVEVLGAAQTV